MSRSPNLTIKYVLALQALLEADKQNAPPDTNCPDTLPRLSASSYAMNTTVNCCALFGTLGTLERREYVKKAFDATNGGRVTDKGPELRQDDKAVLLELIHQRRNMFAGEIEFAPSTLCARMGWSRNSEGSERLRKCLERLDVVPRRRPRHSALRRRGRCRQLCRGPCGPKYVSACAEEQANVVGHPLRPAFRSALP